MTFELACEKIKEADMVLVSLGEEFDTIKALKQDTAYLEVVEKINESGKTWLLPACETYFRQKDQKVTSDVQKALDTLVNALEGKNYFVLSVSGNPMIEAASWKEGRLVSPCGSFQKKQCPSGCVEGLQELSETEKCNIDQIFENTEALESFLQNENPDQAILGTCPNCGKPLICNNVYAEKYDENGYLPHWQHYTKWLQGTLNRKLVILELGVGMKFPSVARWPFEKIAFFNKKAEFIRVNGTLYQMSEELADKGISVPQNAIDWLQGK